MGKTIPSFRIVLAEEKAKWKPFRNALDKKEKKFLKKCGTFLNYSSLLALILFSGAASSYHYFDTLPPLQRAQGMYCRDKARRE